MTFPRFRFAVLVILTCCFGRVTVAQDRGASSTETTRLSVAAFGDYYWVARNHDPELEDQNGFWFRRIYLTVDQVLTETLSARLRFELSHPGDFTSSLTLDPFVKDASLKWRRSQALQVVIGISPTPTWDSVEEFWGYRAVEKTPLDLQRMGSSRDFGVALLGRLGSGQGVRYHLMIGNGSGTGTETNTGKQLALLVGVNPVPQATLEFYVDRDDRPGETDRMTTQVFAGWQRDVYRIGLLYAHQNRELAGPHETDLDIASAFVVVRVRPDVTALLRVDRMFDPNPEGDRIPYLPFDPNARSTLVIAGVDVKLHKRFGVIPNVEWVTYGDSGEAAPSDDLMPRITFYYSF